MIIFHIIAALASIAVSTYAYVHPSRRLLYVSYGLVGLTFASGFYLVVSAPAHMLETCLMGIAYLAVVSLATLGARLKLIRLERDATHLD